jgi:alpha-L-fucosidase 2
MQGPFTQAYQPLGDLRLNFDLSGTPVDYERWLDLTTATAGVRYQLDGAVFNREAWISYPDQALVIRLSCEQTGRLSFVAQLDTPQPYMIHAMDETGLILRGRGPQHADPSYHRGDEPLRYDDPSLPPGLDFEIQLRIISEGGTITTDENGLRLKGADQVTLYLTGATAFGGFDSSLKLQRVDPAERAGRDLAAVISKPYEAARHAHLADYHTLFNRVELDLGQTAAAAMPTDERIVASGDTDDPQLVTLLFQYGRYLLIAASRPGSQPANLQGIWNESLFPPWSSNFTININTEMNYWPAESTNLAECHQPLFDFIADLSISGRRTAEVNYGCRGWTAHHNSDLWRQSAPVGNFGDGNPVWAFWPMAGPWLCQHLWEHYAFSLDETFLLDKAYPIMKEAALFCLDWLIEDGHGRLVTAPSTSPENEFTTPDGQRAAVSMASTCWSSSGFFPLPVSFPRSRLAMPAAYLMSPSA